MKTKINLGCGNTIMPTDEWINHDIVKHREEVEAVFDLNDEEWDLEGLFDEVRAWDVLEHLENPLNFFDNCWQLLKEDGMLDLKVCGWQNSNAHIDLTHRRPGFDIRSFDYLDPETEIGAEYSYYTNRKWHIIDKHYDRKKNILIKLMPRDK